MAGASSRRWSSPIASPRGREHVYASEPHGPALAIATLCFAYQIYCDFSGYSDIAGCRRVWACASPPTSTTPTPPRPSPNSGALAYLSPRFRGYVYLPHGNRGPGAGPSTSAVFAISGLWHGAHWKFFSWGLIHGAQLLGTPLARRYPPPPDCDSQDRHDIHHHQTAWIFFVRTPRRRTARHRQSSPGLGRALAPNSGPAPSDHRVARRPPLRARRRDHLRAVQYAQYHPSHGSARARSHSLGRLRRSSGPSSSASSARPSLFTLNSRDRRRPQQ
jgi:hypothetical protein